MLSHTFYKPPPALLRSDSFTSLRQPGRITPILRPASTGSHLLDSSKGLYGPNKKPVPPIAARGLIRKRPTSTLLIMGDLPSQILELSSDSSMSSAGDAPSSPSPAIVRHRAVRRVPRSTGTRIVVPSLPREDSPASLPDEPEVSPYRGLRRIQSDRFDQVTYERRADAEADAEEERWGGSSGRAESSESGAIDAGARAWAGERGLLLADEEQRVVRRVMDRSVLLDELLRDSTPPRRAQQHFNAPPRYSPVHHIHRASRRPNLPTIPSSRVFQRHQLASTQYTMPRTPERRLAPPSRAVTLVQPVNITPPSDPVSATPPSSDTLPNEGEEGRCDACGRDENQGRKMRMMPCAHIVCSTCFSSSISAVSVTHGPSRCTTCLAPVISFEPVKAFHPPIQVEQDEQDERHAPVTPPRQIQGVRMVDDELEVEGHTFVLRIDNVAWDITPAVVESFLPPDVLPLKHVSPVHILLDRLDGRTKDFLYVEVRSLEAARLVLKTRQNTLMPCGPSSAGRKRFVTISLTTHKELLDELRPKTSAELHSLLKLCQASILINHPATSSQGLYVGYNGVAHFVKDRHGPFNALMSILCHLSGQNSPAYWDLFHVTSGALAALANVISTRQQSLKTGQYASPVSAETIKADQDLLEKLRYLFRTCFSLTPVSSPS